MAVYGLAVFLIVGVTLVTAANDPITCAIKRYGKLTMFTGEEQSVELPCKYRLAEFSCGQYQLQVTPGSSLDGNNGNRFSPQTVWVRIEDSGGQEWIGRTSAGRLRDAEEQKTDVWIKKKGALAFEVEGYEKDSQSAVLEQSDVFRIAFSAGSDDAGVTVTCFSPDRNLSLGAYPKSLCGDGVTEDTVPQARRQLFTDNFDDSNRAMTIIHDVLNNPNVIQSARCDNLAADFQICKEIKKSAAARICAPIFSRRYMTRCLVEDIDDVIDDFDRCLLSVCRNRSGTCKKLKAKIKDNCPEELKGFKDLKC